MASKALVNEQVMRSQTDSYARLGLGSIPKTGEHDAPGTNGKANLVLSASSSAPSGTYPLSITGTADGRVRSQMINLNLSVAQESPKARTGNTK